MEQYKGPFFQIDIIAGVAVFTGRSAPDYTLSEGAQASEASLGLHRELAAREDLHGMVVDMRQMGSLPGPRTQAVIGQIAGFWEAAGRRVAILTSKHPVQPMLLQRILSEHGPRTGRLASSMSGAQAWVRAGIEPGTIEAA